jgi:diguanylate cyclase (GGDEF)-like protein
MKQAPGADSTLRRLVVQTDVSSHEWNASNDELAAGTITPEQSLARLHEQLARYRAALDAGEAIEQEYTTRVSAIRQTVIDIERHWAIASVALAVMAAAAGVIVIMIMRSAVTEAQLARTDALTGLLNRRGFDELAERELSRAHRTGAAITLVAFDVDGFKHVNDNLGHAAGDRLLALIGASIRRAIRDIDVAARLGGDEFAVLLPDNKATPPERAAERVRDVIMQSLRQDHWSTTLSAGAVTVRGYRAPIDEMIHSADKLLYQAKAAGKDALRHQELKS